MGRKREKRIYKNNPRALINSAAFLASYIKHALSDLKPVEIYNAYKTGSWYISFENPEIGSVRIADHPGGNQDFTRWNLRKDLTSISNTKEFGIYRYYYPFACVRKCCEDIRKYALELDAGRVTAPPEQVLAVMQSKHRNGRK